MTVINDIIELIAADRPKWSPQAQESAKGAWKVAFANTNSDVLQKAAVAFLKNQRGTPDVAKLTREIRVVEASLRVHKAVELGVEWSWDDGEKARILEDLETKGDPVADWLEARGEVTERQKRARE
jgi:hypothetical protein